MSVTPVPAIPIAHETIGQEIAGFFSKFGKKIETVATDVLKVIGVAQKEVSTIAPELNATIAIVAPGLTLPVNSAENVINQSLNTSKIIANAIQAGGANPTANQVAAVQIATVLHSLGITSSTTLATALANAAPIPPPA